MTTTYSTTVTETATDSVTNGTVKTWSETGFSLISTSQRTQFKTVIPTFDLSTAIMMDGGDSTSESCSVDFTSSKKLKMYLDFHNVSNHSVKKVKTSVRRRGVPRGMTHPPTQPSSKTLLTDYLEWPSVERLRKKHRSLRNGRHKTILQSRVKVDILTFNNCMNERVGGNFDYISMYGIRTISLLGLTTDFIS